MARGQPQQQQRRQQQQPRDLPAYLLCFVGAVFFNMLSGNSRLLGFPIGPDRLLFGAGLTLLLLDHAAWRQLRLLLRPVHVFSLAVIGLATWSAYEHGTLGTSLGFYALLDRLAVPFLTFALAPVIFSTPARRDVLLRCLVVMGLYLGATAIFEMVGPKSLVYPRFILDPNVGIQFGRARGPFTASEADGIAMLQCGFAAAFASTRLPGAWKLLSRIAVALCAVGVLLTLTRSVWVGTGLGVVLACVLTRGLRKFLLPLVAAAALVVAVAFAAVPGLKAKATTRATTQRSVHDRQNTDAAALRIIERHPLTGVGWLRFIEVDQAYVRQAHNYPITNIDIEVHNVPLSRMAELGIPGGTLWLLAVLAGPCLVLFRRAPHGDLAGWRVASIGGTGCWLVAIMLSPVPYPLPNLLVWLESGIALIPYLAAPRPSQDGGYASREVVQRTPDAIGF
ncbi:MAG: putative inorganic carbon ((-)) transporter [Actinomycetota bacterium]|nr:putative inorganic carbon ((-)) transporter [Actinomycetota bacterium]